MTRELEIISKENEAYGLQMLEDLYEQKIIPREKKPYIINYKKSVGPYMALDNKDGHRYLLDASSQIASLSLGFNPTALFGVAHHMEAWTNDLYSENSRDIIKAFEGFLKRKCGHDGLRVSFTNSGSESNETALLMAYNKRTNKSAKKVLALEGSFHGRMLTSLFSTWNKTKREPFQIEDFESIFSPYPEMKELTNDVYASSEMLKVFENPFHEKFDKRVQELTSKTEDKLFSEEIKCLLDTHNKLSSGDIFAILIEPMQCEGGDKYASSRYYNLLTILAKAHGVKIIFDEVQTGFHLGRDFFWFKTFKMKDSKNNEIFPDYLSSAKKSQTGFVLSFLGDYHPNDEINYTSILRGFYQGLITDQQSENIHKIEEYVTEKLNGLNEKYSQFSCPRARGIAFSIDCENNEQVMAFIKKRFDLGLLIYPAGLKTLRFRLNTAWKESEINYLFESLDMLAQFVFNDKEFEAPKKFTSSLKDDSTDMYKWHEKLVLAKKDGIANKEATQFAQDFFNEKNIQLETITSENFSSYKEDIIKIENEVYEPTRRTDISKFERVVNTDLFVAIAIKKDNELIGISFGGQLAKFSDERGMRRARFFNNPAALYMLDTTIINKYQGQSLGRYLKYSFELIAISKGAEYIYGRNRDMLAGSMLNTNISLGAIPEIYVEEDYLDDLKYRNVYIYRSNLRWKPNYESIISKSNNAPLSHISISDLSSEFITLNIPGIVNKVCLSNFISETYIDATKKLAANLPKELRYIFSSSGHSECMDKVYKSLYYVNKNDKKKIANKVLTLGEHNFGQNSMLAYSISYPTLAHFPTHAVNGISLNTIEEELASGKYLAFFINISDLILNCHEDKAYGSAEQALIKIKAICQKHNVYIVYNQTCEFEYSDETTPDALIKYLGGQMGVCALKEELRVDKPLMMISTWDGDEYSLCAYNKSLELKQESLESFSSYGIEQLNKNLINVTSKTPLSLRKLFPVNGVYSLSPAESNYLKDTLENL